MNKRKPDIKQRFSSGNQLEIFITEFAPRVFSATVEWANFPPTPQDVSEYQKLVPQRYAAKMAALVRQRSAQWN